jgi:CHAT domain-containing protein
MSMVSKSSAGAAIAAKLYPLQRMQYLPAVLALLLTAAMPVLAQSVAMVTDLTGKAVLQGAHGKVNLTMLTEIAGDARVQLDGGARLTAIYLGSGDEYVFSGPAQIQFRAAAPQVLSGAAPQKRASAPAKSGKQVTIRLSSVTQAGLVMRSHRTTGRIPLLTLVGTRTLESSPEFRWRETSPGTRYSFKLADSLGKPLYEAEVEGTVFRLPAPVQLKENTVYTWEISAPFPDGRRYVSTGDFSLASGDLRAQAEALKPAADAPVAERVLYAVWLEREELRDEAKKYWKALLAERPDDATLQALAGETTHPPRTVSDIVALLDQYRPDPEKIEALKAKVGQEPPAGANPDTLFRFYRERAAAAQGLGMAKRQLADLHRAAELVKGDEEEWNVVQDIFLAELQSGNFASALKLKKQMRALVGNLYGRLIPDYQHAVFMYTSIGDLDAARDAFSDQQAVMFKLGRSPNWVRLGDNWTAHFEAARALILNGEGKYTEAEVAARKALAAAERFFSAQINLSGAPVERLYFTVEVMRLRLARNLVLQGRLAEAELEVRNVLQSRLSRLGRYAPGAAVAVGEFVRVLNEQGRFREAETMARAAIDIHKTIHTAPGAISYVMARRALGAALIMQGRWKAGLAAYEGMRAGLAGDPELLQTLGRGDPNWALALIKTGRAAEAVPILEKGLARLSDQLGPSHYNVAQLHGFLGMAYAESGQNQRALAEFQEAMKHLLGGSGEEEASPARVRRQMLILEGYIELLYEIRNDLGQQQAGFDPAAEAFRLADALRGQGVQRAFAASAARAAATTPELAELVRKAQDTQQQIAVLYSTLLGILSAPPDQQVAQSTVRMRQRIQELEQEQRQLFSTLERRFPAYLNLINPRPATIENTRTALRDGEVLLSVLTTEDRTYVWAVPKSGALGFHAAPVGEQPAAEAVAQLRKALDPGNVTLESIPEFDVAGAYRLYEQLLKPVESTWQAAHSLLVVANGAFAQLPFSVLVTAPFTLPPEQGLKFERYRAVPWLAKRVALAQLPAVNTLITLRGLPQANPDRSAFIGFGDPQFGRDAEAAAPARVALRMRSVAMPRAENGKAADWVPYSRLSALPDTREEIMSIATALKADLQRDVFVGAAASKSNVKQADLAHRRIIAFATHGLIPGDFPNLDQPALALTSPDGSAENGLLKLEDILSLKLDADWVVLSACNTAAGDGAGAEAISGLGRGFFYAGSRALLVTHWPVETHSARLLVSDLFQRYSTPGMTRAEALKQASIAVMDAPGATDPNTGKALFSYAHPLFWAPYVLVGDPGR